MKVWTMLTPEQLIGAAQYVGVRAIDIRKDGRAVRFTIKTSGPRPPFGRLSQIRRLLASGEYKQRVVPGAVCWHGHRAFYRAVFALDPDARIQTALADYRGVAAFEREHRTTGMKGGGYYNSSILPYQQACVCEEATP